MRYTCTNVYATHTMVNGRLVVRDGQITTVDLEPLIERHNVMAITLAN